MPYLIKSSRVGKGELVETIARVLLEVELILLSREHGMKGGRITIQSIEEVNHENVSPGNSQ